MATTLYHHNGVIMGSDFLAEAKEQAASVLYRIYRGYYNGPTGDMYDEDDFFGPTKGDTPLMSVWADPAAPTSGFYAQIVDGVVRFTMWDDLV
jgi:hypothetical protein